MLPLMVKECTGFCNRTYVVGPDGGVSGYYDKVHLTLSEKEQYGFRPGSELPVFQLPVCRIALATCYDLYFPELFSALGRNKPDIVFVPSLQRSDHEPANEVRMSSRAMDIQAYIVRSSFGREIDKPWIPGMMFGQSCVVHPDGTLLANAGHYEGVATASAKIPFNWKRPRCGGYPADSVRQFIE